MDRIDFAIRRYRQIVPTAGHFHHRTGVRRLRLWLTDDVAPVVESYVARPHFRDYASWAIRNLAPGVDTPERREVDAVDEALVRYARALTQLASKKRVQQALRKRFPPQRQVVEGTGEIGAGPTVTLVKKTKRVDTFALSLSQTAGIAKRPWQDLVNIADYFEPQQEFVKGRGSRNLQRAELIVSLNPELHPIGNFIVRCMFRRLEGMIAILDDVDRKLMQVMKKISHTYRQQGEIDEARKTVHAALATLRATHQSGDDCQLYDSCAILMQVYAASHPSPDLGWLGLSSRDIQRGTTCLQGRMTSFANAEMFDRIAVAVGDLTRLYDGRTEAESAVDEAIAAGGLVVDMQRKRVFWDRELVDCKWNKFHVSWRFLLALATKAGHHADVTADDLYPGGTSRTALSTNAERIKKLLPPSLRSLIIPGRTVRSYRLDLEPHRIHIFRAVAHRAGD